MPSREPETSGLSRETVIRAALELLDTDGVDGLSMRALAERLGVKAASLYWHLRDKEQLLELVAEDMLDRVEVPLTPPGWRLQATTACDQLTVFLAQHRAAAGVLLGCLPTVRRSRLTRDLTRTLALAGLDEAAAAAFALVVETVAAAPQGPEATPRPSEGSVMTLAIDSGSWRALVRAAPPGTVEPARSVGGGGAATVDLRPDNLVLVRSRRGGNRGAVELSPDYTWYIKVHGGTWNNVLDLTGLRISGIELDSGAGNLTCTLPAPAGVVPIRVNSGIVGVSFRRPRNTAVHATVSSGSMKVRFDDQAIRTVTSDVHWETPGASRADERFELTVYSGCVRVTMDASAPAGPPAPPPAVAGGRPAHAAPATQGASLVLDGIEKRLADRSAVVEPGIGDA